MGVRVPPFAPASRPPSQTTLRISAAGSRFAHARKAPQLTIWRGNPWGFESPLSHQPPQILRQLRSGFRLRAPASLTPAKRLNLRSGGETHGGSSPPFRTNLHRSFANCAQDFGCGLPLRSRPQSASTYDLAGKPMGVRVPPFAPTSTDPSPTALRISAAGSRFAHARKAPQLTIWRGNPWGFESPLSHQPPQILRQLRSGFRLRAPASLTPAKRLNLRSGGET